MKFDDDWKQESVLDAYSISDDEYRFDRVETCVVVCTDIVGGARLFEELPLEDFTALLADYLGYVRAVFGQDRIYHTLRDDIFIAFEGTSDEPLRLALDFVDKMRESALPFQCSVGISSGDVAILTHGGAAEPQGAPVAVAKGLAKIAQARGIFIDEKTALAVGASRITPLTVSRRVRLPHVGRSVAVQEVVGAEGALGIKARFARAFAGVRPSLGA